MLPLEYVIGVCIIATAPVTVVSGTVMTALGKGNIPLSLFICVLGNFMGVFTIPFSLKLLTEAGGDVDLRRSKCYGVWSSACWCQLFWATWPNHG